MGTKGSGDTPAVSEERNAAALRIIRRAKRAGMARDRAYSTSEGIYNLHYLSNDFNLIIENFD